MSTNNIGMNNISEEQLIVSLAKYTKEQLKELMQKVKQHKRVEKQKSTCKSVTKKIVIDDYIAGRLRFPSGELLKIYMNKNGIDEANFKNENKLVDYLLEYLIDDESDIWHYLSEKQYKI